MSSDDSNPSAAASAEALGAALLPVEAVPPAPAAPASSMGQPAGPAPLARWLLVAALVAAAVALAVCAMLWQKLSHIQEELARRSADSGAQAVEAKALARQAQDLARDTAARLAVSETRISEVALQRTQLEELMQSLSRSRDENLVVDIESALRLAQQQAQLTGSVEPLLAAIRTADQRVARAAQPRLTPLQRALARDIDRLRAASVTDTPGLLIKLDELVRLVDELPVANAVGPAAPSGSSPGRKPAPAPAASTTWLQQWGERVLEAVLDEARALVRVSRIDRPEAALLTPEQSFFLRENLKLKILNARLGLLARQTESARADLASAAESLGKYFDPAARRTQATATLMQQVQGQMKSVEIPRIDETLAALATAAAGR